MILGHSSVATHVPQLRPKV